MMTINEAIKYCKEHANGTDCDIDNFFKEDI